MLVDILAITYHHDIEGKWLLLEIIWEHKDIISIFMSYTIPPSVMGLLYRRINLKTIKWIENAFYNIYPSYSIVYHMFR